MTQFTKAASGRLPILLAGFLAGVFYVVGCGGGGSSFTFDEPEADACGTVGAEIPNLFRHIRTPGRYYLTRSHTAAAGQWGIKIESSNVTIDLNGHTMTGGPGTDAGIFVADDGGQQPLCNIRIMNGNLEGWGGSGIWLANTINGSISDIRVKDCAGDGIRVGSAYLVRDCQALSCRQDGIHVGSYCVVSRCTSAGSGGDGFEADAGVSLDRCIAAGSNGSGLKLGRGSTATVCQCIENNGQGVDSDAALLVDCQLAQNNGHGVNASLGTVVRGCRITRNRGRGVEALGAVDARDNYLQRNGDSESSTNAAIRATGPGCRFEGNFIGKQGIGIEFVAFTDQLVIRNNFHDVTTPVVGEDPQSLVGPLVGSLTIKSDQRPHANYGPDDPNGN